MATTTTKSGTIIPHLYILHGWAYDSQKWEILQRALEKTNIEATLLRIPGLTSPLDRPYDISDYISWIDTSIEKKTPVILLGHSNGGRLAFHYALEHPSNISHLILIDSAGVEHTDIVSQMKKNALLLLAKMGKKVTRSNFLRNLLYTIAREKDYQEASPVMRKTMQNLLAADHNFPFSKIAVPTALIWGEKDTITPLVDGLTMHAKIKNSKMYTIPEARHAPQFTHPERIVKIIEEIIERISKDSI
ncbi:hypothetical protein A3D80_01400 [Candidatus Roizmanbacteria bacterium RIFCSPHIGHO2_02_FULL_40_13b]|uniref:AB hydrolase-1 domain-containing protein n=1 Tax=Candidatus Roizmanbacteria bacterium RIFCSPHIGHO2_01_FULL_39_24 TaxID=1802032 RepID=A0A1F7GE88_9BACT|nr:MAG: hypothetical protein A2799_03405 [Candidatus Roizmanbacteria bacterium RIFCSPHIGHO2_01_FULL_39_24]OGK26223.1 MAG: hypothetical protein A3D80_01400 [Candidatus Roizmanbacteria bacterium RIFCSPHIGHO2_02_FULL_40_13b]OGK50375.1 MAG: hypothetical protein A3A56_00340 [Candidatus Roizmanbacteria bacterium RIFCSPLOWO2_01_FULL_40_32]OGK56218.1 MAG: hypothetical protein A3H83_01735 [Candidatus Roizmanbacteria bacterium RIFCSPLOWO2_02_FULL_39_8]